MLRFYFRLTLIPLALFTIALLLIRAQPYDNHELRELLLPEGCSAPCFMGIRPGVTTKDEAIQLLKLSEWVGDIWWVGDTDSENGAISDVEGSIFWNWSIQKPNWIIENSQGQIRATDYLIHSITIFSSIRLGEMQLLLGSPENELVDATQDRSGKSFVYNAFYYQKGLFLSNRQPCNVVEPLRSQVDFTYLSKSEINYYPQYDLLGHIFHVCSN